MRGLRSFLVLVVVAAALGGLLYYDSKRPPSDEKKNEKVFADVQSDKIDQITVKSEKGETTAAAKQGDRWQQTQPMSVPADEAEISGITSNLASLEVQRVAEEQPKDLKEFGLDPPRIEVSFRQGGKDHKLMIGGKTPTGGDLYARTSDKPRVFIVASYLDGMFNKSPFDLRDKAILKFDRDKADRLEIEAPDRTLKIAKQGADWRITAPVDARADFGVIEGILGRLNSTPMKAITVETADPEKLKEYGLDKPAVTARVGAGSTQAALAIGKTAGDGVFYARDLSRPLVFTIETALTEELKRPTDDLRIKDLFDARSFNTTRIEISRGGQTMTFEKDKDAWKQVSPAAKAADATKVEALLTVLTGTRATGFADTAPALETPEVTVSLKFDQGKQEKVSFARKGTDAFARRQGDASAAKIDVATIDAITKAIDALK